MNNVYRILDANINRASEGLRVLEDLARFYYNNKEISGRLKEIRHAIRKKCMRMLKDFLNSRDSINDVGLSLSKELGIDNKETLIELACANFKRIQEALRTIEENLRIIGQYEISKFYEECRFEAYDIEKAFFIATSKEKRRARFETDLYCITAQEHSKGRNNIEVVHEMIKAGVKVIQYREKDKKLKEKYYECMEIRKITKDARTTFIINDDIDIAMLVKADGVHIGQDDLPIEKVRELVGNSMIIGLSTHSQEQAKEAVEKGADYIGVGPIYRTYTKKDVCEPVGLDYLDYVVKNIDIPFVAIGGIKENNIHEVISCGARCIAMVTAVVGSDNIEEYIKGIREKISRGVM
jgi:thiamine-phosphate pyrophosphorylase